MAIAASCWSAGVAGATAGAMHAVTGADHLAALLPMCMGKPWHQSCLVGGFWGLGHGIGASVMGALAFTLRGSFNVLALSDYLEIAVGMTLLVIGLVGLKSTRDWYLGQAKKHEGGGCSHDGHSHHGLSHEGFDIETPALSEHSSHRHSGELYRLRGSTVVLTGIFHGFSGTGHLLGVIPALMMPTWKFASAYLIMFCLGTTAAMSGFTGAVGQLSLVMGARLSIPDLPARLSSVTSVFAMAMGMWYIVSHSVGGDNTSDMVSGADAASV